MAGMPSDLDPPLPMNPIAPSPSVKVSLRLYRTLLRLMPRAFRREYEDWILQAFRDQGEDIFFLRGNGGLIVLWIQTVPDVLSSAVAERLEGTSVNWRSLLGSSPNSRPVMWFALFVPATLAAFLLATATFSWLDYLLRGPLHELGSGFPARWLLHGGTSLFIMAFMVAAAQSLLLLGTGVSPRRWFLATSIGWLAGIYAGSAVWSATGDTVGLFLWQRFPLLARVTDPLVRGLTGGLLIGLAQWLALRPGGRRILLWIPFSVAALVAFLLAARALTGSHLLPAIPPLLYSLIAGAGLILVLHDASHEARQPGNDNGVIPRPAQQP